MGSSTLHATVVDLGTLEADVDSPDDLFATVVELGVLTATVEDA
jgi:hypothetical protein